MSPMDLERHKPPVSGRNLAGEVVERQIKAVKPEQQRQRRREGAGDEVVGKEEQFERS